MRIRSTKPEFWRSERVASVDWDARLVLKALESYVDDNGVGKDDLALIVGDTFMRDLVREPSRTLARVSEAISALFEAGLVHRYEAGGTNCLYLSFWESFQRIDHPAKGRLPRPDGTFEYGESQIGEPLATSREASRSVAPGTGEQGNRGTGEQGQHPLSAVAVATPRRDDVEYLLDVLDADIARNGSKVPKRTKRNYDAMRLMIDLDGHSVEQIERAIHWCQADEFWRPNILSASKLRAKYDQLRLAAQRPVRPTHRPTRDDENLAVVAALAARESEMRGIGQ